MILSWVRILLLLMPLATNAATWQIIPKESAINFTATQNGAPVSGQFKSFSGEINFDPTQLATSNVRIVVDINSVMAAYDQVVDTLKTADWFNVKLFPQAIFKSSNFTKTGDNTYQANGTLTIRDKTAPIMLTFVMEEYSKSHARAKGTATLQRTTFGVGQGEWAKTDEIKDEVKINFTLAATRN